MVATCSESESGSNPSSRVLYHLLHLLPLEPLVGAILVVAAAVPSAKSNCTSTMAPARPNNTKKEVRTKRRMRTQLRKRMRTGHTTARSTLFHHIYA